jgi:hypothetical protein
MAVSLNSSMAFKLSDFWVVCLLPWLLLESVFLSIGSVGKFLRSSFSSTHYAFRIEYRVSSWGFLGRVEQGGGPGEVESDRVREA